jgi:hypothetical protein
VSEQRIKAIAFTPQALLSIFAQGAIIEMPNGERYECVINTPKDAAFHHAFYEPREGWFAIVMEHESFPPKSENSAMRFEPIELKEVA